MTDRVMVTGISGFLGGHVARALLAAGWAVRGSVRDPARADRVRTALADARADVSRLEFCTLDLRSDEGWNEAAAGCRSVIHVASPFVTVMPADESELIEPAVMGTRRALNAALRAGCERIVLTSSTAAIDGGHRNLSRPLTTDDWTELEAPHVNAYLKSKTLAERAAWDLVGAENARDRLVVINPGAILGPLLDDDPGTSADIVRRMLTGAVPMLPRLILPYVDVRDVADAHVAALTAATAGGRRHIVTGPAASIPAMAQILRRRLPEHVARMPKREIPGWLMPAIAKLERSLGDNLNYLDIERAYDTTSGIELLGRPLIPFEESVVATAQSLIERGLV